MKLVDSGHLYECNDCNVYTTYLVFRPTAIKLSPHTHTKSETREIQNIVVAPSICSVMGEYVIGALD